MRNAVDGDPVDFEGVGVALPLGAGSLGALRRRAWQATQEHHPMGVAAIAFDQALASRARDRRRRRRRIRFPQAPRQLPEALREPITFITRLRLDAALYEPAPPRYPGQMGRPRLKGERLPNLSNLAEDPDALWSPITVAGWYGGEERVVEIISKTAVWYSTGLPAVPLRWVLIRDPEKQFETQALLCSDLSAEPERIISWFVRRWRMEATFQEVRQRLGFETQRHWSKMAILRTAPAMLSLFSLVVLFAHRMMADQPTEIVRRAAWYEKTHPTFSDTLALVRKELWVWEEETFCGSAQENAMVRVSQA
jgi:hypothetical protein